MIHGLSRSAGTQGVNPESEHASINAACSLGMSRISVKSNPPEAITFIGSTLVNVDVGGSGGGGGWGGRINKASKR